MDYEKERSRTRFHYSPPRAYRKHSRPHRRERLESDIPPETREEREQRLEFERKLRKRAQREEDEVFGETKESHRDEEFRKKGREDRAALVKAGELQMKGGEAVVEEGSWKEREKFDQEDENGCKEVHQGDSTPSLSPETMDDCDKEGKERSLIRKTKMDVRKCTREILHLHFRQRPWTTVIRRERKETVMKTRWSMTSGRKSWRSRRRGKLHPGSCVRIWGLEVGTRKLMTAVLKIL